MNVALFVTCLTDTFFPRVGVAVVRVLRHFGCHVAFPPEQTCCGQPAFSSGFRDEAAAVAGRMIEIFEPYEYVVTPSASCAAMVKHHFVELFTDDPYRQAAARRLANKTHEFTVFLREQLKVDIAAHLRFDGRRNRSETGSTTSGKPAGSPEPAAENTVPITFHYACHAKNIYPLGELADCLVRAAGEKLVPPPHPEVCCGFGGAFAADFPDISAAMLNEKLDALTTTGARTVVCNEGGCSLHLCGGAHRRGLPLRFVHLAECLAESLGLMEADR